MQIILLLLLLFTAGWAQPDAGENSGNKSDFGGPTGGQFVIGDQEGFGLGTAVNDPTAL